MPLYETVFIARQDLSSAQTDQLTQGFSQIINDNGGRIAKTENWGLRNLAYKIRKNKKGHYTMFQLDAPPAAMQEMERQMRLSEDILRYMTIKIDELEEGQSIMLRQKDRDESERGDRSMSDRYRGGNDNEEFAEPQSSEQEEI